MDAAYKIVKYLHKHSSTLTCYGDLVPQSNPQQFVRSKWDNSIYVGAMEEEPPHAPKPLGNSVEMCCFVEVEVDGRIHCISELIQDLRTGVLRVWMERGVLVR